jgi:hypothetical protein
MPVYIVSHKYLHLGNGNPNLYLRFCVNREQSATALGKLGHPDGELTLTRAAAKHGVIQMVC